MDIKQLIGEATEYDKKEKLEIKRPKSWCKSISAFANSFGGFLVFGVTNNDEFIGMPEAEKDAELISEYIKTYPVLADVFNRLKYMERRGSGFKKIMPDYQEQPNYSEEKKPLFEADNDDFVLTLFNMNYEMQAKCVGQKSVKMSVKQSI